MGNECILCGKCLSACPLIAATNREELGPRAKTDLCRLLKEQPDLLKSKDVKKLANNCLGCYRCKEVCSQGMNAPALVSELRHAHPDLKGWLWKTWLSNTKLWSTGSSAASHVPKEFQPGKLGQHLKMLAGLKGDSGIEPFLKIKSFSNDYRGEKMLLFAGCTATHVQGRWLVAAMRLLDGMGVDVLPGDFQCCGSSLKGAGFPDDAKELAHANIAVWRAAGRPKVLTFCASCLAGLKGYDDLFLEDDERKMWEESLTPLSAIVRNISFELSENAPKKLGYHHPCHAGDDDQDHPFLQGVLGENLVAATDKECCGFGGVMRLSAAEIADEVNAQCWERLNAATVILTGCSACATQLKNTAPKERLAGHWLETIFSL